METLNMVSKNYKLVEALKLSNIKPCLSSINLMYIWAFKKEPLSSSTYLGMLEDIFADENLAQLAKRLTDARDQASTNK